MIANLGDMLEETHEGTKQQQIELKKWTFHNLPLDP